MRYTYAAARAANGDAAGASVLGVAMRDVGVAAPAIFERCVVGVAGVAVELLEHATAINAMPPTATRVHRRLSTRIRGTTVMRRAETDREASSLCSFAASARRRATVEQRYEDRSRQRRGLGPFTGGQITLIIVAIIVAVGVPFTAGAVTGNNVFLTDFTSGAHAKVDASGNVQTKVNGAVTVAGSVTATQAAPSNMFAVLGEAGNTSATCGFFTPRAGSAAIITSIDESPDHALSTAELQVRVQSDSAAACGGTKHDVAFDIYSSDTPHTVPVTPGIGLASGHSLDITATGGNPGTLVIIEVHGYYVPAAQCASGCI
jgi:hypothetical protein